MKIATDSFSSGLDETQTRDLLRDRQEWRDQLGIRNLQLPHLWAWFFVEIGQVIG